MKISSAGASSTRWKRRFFTNTLADQLRQAHQTAVPIRPLTDQHPDLSIEDAYGCCRSPRPDTRTPEEVLRTLRGRDRRRDASNARTGSKLRRSRSSATP